MCRLTRCYEARCGWVCLGDCGRRLQIRLPIGLPGHHAKPPGRSRAAEALRDQRRRGRLPLQVGLRAAQAPAVSPTHGLLLPGHEGLGACRISTLKTRGAGTLPSEKERTPAARLDMFGRLNRHEDIPGIEHSVIPAATGESPADGDFLNLAVT